MPDRARELFQDTVAAVWNGRNESDGFNALVLAAGLTWRQATVLRAYAKYMRQGGTPVRAGLHRGRAAQQRGDHALPRAAVRGAVRPRPARPQRRRHPCRQRGAAGQVRRPRGAHRARPRRGLEPRPRPDPAVLPDRHPRDAAHQLLRHRLRRASRSTGSRSRSTRPRSRSCPSRGRSSRSSSTHPASRACTCASARSPAAGCAGPTDATTSAPRSWGWSRRRWSRTP